MYQRVLIIEDERPFRRIIARNLTSRGCQVLEADTAEAGVKTVLSEEPDLLLLDLNLPDKSGWDVLRQLRKKGIKVPTIIVSAVNVGADRLNEFKPMAYLPKPFPLDALLRLVEGSPAPAEPEPEIAVDVAKRSDL
jgi:DNA-binding response OmpR family regulator